jgi:hypothetical protein
VSIQTPNTKRIKLAEDHHLEEVLKAQQTNGTEAKQEHFGINNAGGLGLLSMMPFLQQLNNGSSNSCFNNLGKLILKKQDS